MHETAYSQLWLEGWNAKGAVCSVIYICTTYVVAAHLSACACAYN